MMQTSAEIYRLEDLDLFFCFQNGSVVTSRSNSVLFFVFLASFAFDEGLF